MTPSFIFGTFSIAPSVWSKPLPERRSPTLWGDDVLHEACFVDLSIIGEAAKQVPQEVRDKYPSTDWRNISRMRDLLVHVYFGLSDQIMWDAITKNVPALIH